MPTIQVVMGSQSDAGIVKASGLLDILDTLEGSGMSYQVSVCSAHRNAPDLQEFADQTLQEGTQIYIGIAGMAAALPGALAACTRMSKPIIAVPLDEHGIDSCLYMPPGVPVLLAGVGKEGLKNAGIAALQILATGNSAPAKVALADYLIKNQRQPQFNINPYSPQEAHS